MGEISWKDSFGHQLKSFLILFTVFGNRDQIICQVY